VLCQLGLWSIVQRRECLAHVVSHQHLVWTDPTGVLDPVPEESVDVGKGRAVRPVSTKHGSDDAVGVPLCHECLGQPVLDVPVELVILPETEANPENPDQDAGPAEAVGDTGHAAQPPEVPVEPGPSRFHTAEVGHLGHRTNHFFACGHFKSSDITGETGSVAGCLTLSTGRDRTADTLEKICSVG
jgi:hypothetical protein